MVDAVRETVRPFACQPVLGHELAGERQHQRDDRDRDRTAHAVGRDGERDSGLRAGLGVDIVVADAEARDEAEAPVGMDALGREARHQQDERVDIRHLRRRDRAGPFQEQRLDAGRRAQRRQIEVREGRRAVGLPEIAREGHAEGSGADGGAHGPGPYRFFLARLTGAGAAGAAAIRVRRAAPARPSQASRSLPSASASALCSTQTSPE